MAQNYRQVEHAALSPHTLLPLDGLELRFGPVFSTPVDERRLMPAWNGLAWLAEERAVMLPAPALKAPAAMPLQVPVLRFQCSWRLTVGPTRWNPSAIVAAGRIV